MKLEPKQKYRTTDKKNVVVQAVAKRGRGYSVTYAGRGQAAQTVPLARFRALVNQPELSVA